MIELTSIGAYRNDGHLSNVFQLNISTTRIDLFYVIAMESHNPTSTSNDEFSTD